MSDPAKSKEHMEWLQRVIAELGIDEEVLAAQDSLLNMTARVAHGPSRPAAPITAYLIGYAAGARESTLPKRRTTLLSWRKTGTHRGYI